MRFSYWPHSKLHRALLLAVMLVILALTLTPSGDAPSPAFSFALTLARRELADGILNLLLFVPLGTVLAWNSGRVAPATICGALLSFGIEVAQTIVPGRDPALSDILFNSAGAFVGAIAGCRPREWLTPRRKESLVLTISGLVGCCVIMVSTALLLAPLDGTPLRGERKMALPASVSNAWRDGRTLIAVQIAGSEDGLLIARSGNDLLLRYPARAGAMGLDQADYWLTDAFAPTPGVSRISFERDRARWRISIDSLSATVGPTIGEGWALLAYPDALARRWAPFISGLWVLALCLPVGFWARTRASLVAAGFLVVLLIFVPVATGVLDTTGMEWLGALIGFGMGRVLARSFGVRTSDGR
jgi:VanZ family protein